MADQPESPQRSKGASRLPDLSPGFRAAAPGGEGREAQTPRNVPPTPYGAPYDTQRGSQTPAANSLPGDVAGGSGSEARPAPVIIDEYCIRCFAPAVAPRPGREPLCMLHLDMDLADEVWQDHKERLERGWDGRCEVHPLRHRGHHLRARTLPGLPAQAGRPRPLRPLRADSAGERRTRGAACSSRLPETPSPSARPGLDTAALRMAGAPMSFLQDYEPVEDRLREFWHDHPYGRVITTLEHHGDGDYIVRAVRTTAPRPERGCRSPRATPTGLDIPTPGEHEVLGPGGLRDLGHRASSSPTRAMRRRGNGPAARR